MASWNPQANDLFLNAAEITSPEARRVFLDEACAGDAELRGQVEALLQAGEQAGSFLQVPPRTPTATSAEPPLEGPGTKIGPYRLMEQIGEGGFGLVFVAEQQEPVKRRVALKVIKPGMDTRQVTARFTQERQALALMDHPNIARVLDAGTTESGRPYFVMELVKGVPITEYCDKHQLPPKERLELFITVCQAIQHAHLKGVIHRDIKPSNVLVTSHDGRPVVKVIDFGVAKAIHQPLTERTIYTNIAQMIGTPLYMSPEQAEMSGLDIDTRSDIYSLGVLLYELLTGTTPIERKRFAKAAYDEIRRLIREEEPPKPSTRLSTSEAIASVAAQRDTEPAKLSKLVRGDLDWITMKCLEKDRTRRYETANALARDLQHYLSDEPVEACPPSATYRLRKFARKNRTALRFVAAFVGLLALAAGVGTWQAVRATLAERQARAERDRAEAGFRMARDAVDRSFTQVSQSPQLKAQDMETFRRHLLQTAREFYERFAREQFDAPAARYDLGLAYRRLADIDRELSDYPAAEESAAKAIAILGELARTQPDRAEYQRDLAASHTALGQVHANAGRWDQAEAAYQQALVIQEWQARAHPESAECRRALADTYIASGFALHFRDRPEAATNQFRQALAELHKAAPDEQLTPEHQALLAKAQLRLGQLASQDRRLDEAEHALTDAARIYERLARDRPDAGPVDRQSLARSKALLGEVFSRKSQTAKGDEAGRLAEQAEQAQRQALQIFERLTKEHPNVLAYAYDVGRCHYSLAGSAYDTGRLDAALTNYDAAIEKLDQAVARGYLAARSSAMNARLERAITLAKKGDHVRAADQADALGQSEGLNSINVYNLACVYAQAVAAADRDPNLALPDHTRLKSNYAERAVSFLRRAVDKGYNNSNSVKKDPDLDPLRDRADFQKLCADLEVRQKPSGAGPQAP